MVRAAEMGVEAYSSAPISLIILVAERCFIVLAVQVMSVVTFNSLRKARQKTTHRSTQDLRLSILPDRKGVQGHCELLRASRISGGQQRVELQQTGQADRT